MLSGLEMMLRWLNLLRRDLVVLLRHCRRRHAHRLLRRLLLLLLPERCFAGFLRGLSLFLLVFRLDLLLMLLLSFGFFCPLPLLLVPLLDLLKGLESLEGGSESRAFRFTIIANGFAAGGIVRSGPKPFIHDEHVSLLLLGKCFVSCHFSFGAFPRFRRGWIPLVQGVGQLVKQLL